MNEIPNQLLNEIRKVIHGKDEVIKLTLCAIFAGGHVLLEDIPGVGKTTLAVSISKALSMEFSDFLANTSRHSQATRPHISSIHRWNFLSQVASLR